MLELDRGGKPESRDTRRNENDRDGRKRDLNGTESPLSSATLLQGRGEDRQEHYIVTNPRDLTADGDDEHG